MTQEKQLYTIPEAAQKIGVSIRSVYSYIYERKLPAQKIGGKWRVTADSLDAFLCPPPSIKAAEAESALPAPLAARIDYIMRQARLSYTERKAREILAAAGYTLRKHQIGEYPHETFSYRIIDRASGADALAGVDFESVIDFIRGHKIDKEFFEKKRIARIEKKRAV